MQKNQNHNKSKIIGIIVSAALVGAFIFVYGSGYFRSNPNPSFEGLYENYPYLGKLAGDSTAIIVGKVSSNGDSHISEILGIPVTTFKVEVEEVLKGDLKKGDVIPLQQYGALAPIKDKDGKEVTLPAIEDETTYLVTGQRYVLFLGTTTETDVYGTLGGPQGQYWIDEKDLVYSLDNVNSDINPHADKQSGIIQVKENGKPLETFESEIAAAIKDPEATKPIPPPVEETFEQDSSNEEAMDK